MNRDTLIRQLGGADVHAPDHDLPETARTSTVALTEIRRRIDMDVKELTHPVEPEPRPRRGWLVAEGAFAVFVALIAGAWLLQPDGGRDTAADPSDDVETAERLSVAIYEGDWAAIEPLMTDDFGFGTPPDGYEDLTAEAFRNVVAFYGAGVDPRDVTFECRDAGFGSLVLCDVEVEDPRLDLSDGSRDETRQNRLEFEFLDGRLLDVGPHWDLTWAEELVGLAESSNPDGYRDACRGTPDVRTINGVVFDASCGGFLAAYSEELVVQLTDSAEAAEQAELEISAEEQAVLDEFVAAVNTADPDTIEALLAPGFVTTSSDDMRASIEADGSFAALFHAYYAAEGSVYTLDDCRAVDAGILCESTWSGVVPRATFGVDFTGREVITIFDGQIQSIRHTPRQWPSTLPWLSQGRLDLIEWVRTINPEDAVVMESGEESYGGFRLDVAPLWQKYAEQWIEAGRP